MFFRSISILCVFMTIGCTTTQKGDLDTRGVSSTNNLVSSKQIERAITSQNSGTTERLRPRPVVPGTGNNYSLPTLYAYIFTKTDASEIDKAQRIIDPIRPEIQKNPLV